MTTKLEKLLQQQAKLKLEIAKEKTKTNKQLRKDETRKKILIGSLVQSHVEKDADFKQLIETLLNEGLTRNNDRVLFGLSPIEEDKPTIENE